jgi:magnesium-protoporphyrin O-methyltransferase
MTCCGTSTCSKHFDRKRVLGELRNYQQHGPVPTTRALIQALQRAGVGDGSLLDIGGGVGAIQYALLTSGASEVTSVEASQAYLDAARARPHGRLERPHPLPVRRFCRRRGRGSRR